MVGPPSDGFQLGAFFVSGLFSAGHVAASGSRSAGARTGWSRSRTAAPVSAILSPPGIEGGFAHSGPDEQTTQEGRWERGPQRPFEPARFD